MLFNSVEYVVLVLVTAALFYFPPLRSAQSIILVLASLIFYAWEKPWLLTLLAASILLNSAVSRRIAFGLKTHIRGLLVLGLVFNLLLLATFKYGRLAAHTLDFPDRGLAHVLMTIPLPIGISFYTFESISLLVDLYRGRKRGEAPFVSQQPWEHLRSTSLFFAFFPHLISGPILKASSFYPQIQPKNAVDIPWVRVCKLCILGFFLKMVIADNLKDATANLGFPQFAGFSSITLVALLIGYSMQIFADFAGYSLIAIGVALIFGYQLPDNFNFPYLSSSLGDFWRRWHISLSTWLREYLYYSLGGNRRGPARTYLNLFIVMALGGLWHGAAWSFAVWGIYHGMGLAVERWILDRYPRAYDRIPNALRMMAIFAFVTAGWLFFKLSFREAVTFAQCLVRNWHFGLEGQKALLLSLVTYSIPVVIYHAGSQIAHFRQFILRQQEWIYGGMLAGIVISQGLPGAFIYFQF